MKRYLNRQSVAALLGVLILLAMVNRTWTLRAIAGERTVRVALVYASSDAAAARIRAAYGETLRESGIAFDWLNADDLAMFDANQLADTYAAIVFPDLIDQRIDEDAVAELTAFAARGRLVAVVGDAGSRTSEGHYRPGSLFAAITGVDSFLYNALRIQAFSEGPLHFADPASRARWSVPSGKVERGNLSGYGYGPLEYPYSRAALYRNNVRVDASTGTSPNITVRTVGRGSVAFIGLPLGYLRTHSDAFPMTLLISYLTSTGRVPHLVAAPRGVGALIIDIHVDSAQAIAGVADLRRRGLLRADVPMEFDVTAGPDFSRPGDRLGFDACGRGRAALRTLMQYGRIGSQGGWAYDTFAADVHAGRDSEAHIRALIARNDACLASVTGAPVRSFAAPDGDHPQPTMTQVLDDLGIRGYYYTGDTGAPAERAFYDGNLVSASSWAFPVMPLGSVVSVAEMQRAHIPPARVQRWLTGTASYAADRRAIYLVTSHAQDFRSAGYAQALSRSLDDVQALRRAGRLNTTDMVAASAFMDRFITTTASFTRSPDGVHVRLDNPRGLRAIAVAIPTAWIGPGALPAPLHRTGVQGTYTILSVDADPREVDVVIPKATAS